MKKVFEKIIEGILACSGFVTSLTIVLIVLFLFSEAVGLFHSRVIEEGYVLALNKDNKVSELTPVQIKDVFDEEITNWREVGGENLPIRLFRLEDVTRYYTEEQLGASYENAGACITDLVERGFCAEAVHCPSRLRSFAAGQHHFAERRLCGSRVVSYGYTCSPVRLLTVDNGYVVGKPFRHSHSLAVRIGGGRLYVRGG